MTPNVCRSSAELRPNSHMLPRRTEPNIRPNSSAELRCLPNFGPSLAYSDIWCRENAVLTNFYNLQDIDRMSYWHSISKCAEIKAATLSRTFLITFRVISSRQLSQPETGCHVHCQSTAINQGPNSQTTLKKS